jgi:hypothetical protein
MIVFRTCTWRQEKKKCALEQNTHSCPSLGASFSRFMYQSMNELLTYLEHVVSFHAVTTQATIRRCTSAGFVGVTPPSTSLHEHKLRQE